MRNGTFVTFRNFSAIPREVLEGLSVTYAQVFSESPWNETWTQSAVVEKLARELNAEDSFLTVMRGDDTYHIGGFCWGAVVPVRDIRDRVCAVRELTPQDIACLEAMVKKLRASKVLYVDELAIAVSFRGGIGGIFLLSLPFLRLAVKRRLGVLCWSTEESRISPILRGYKFKVIGETGRTQFFWISGEKTKALLVLVEAFAAALPQQK